MATVAQAQARDRQNEQHQQELAKMEKKLEKLRRSNEDTLKQLSDTNARGNRLATSLGFNDISEAQVMIDNSDMEIPYKECMEKVDSLQAELLREKSENERLKEALRLVEDERDALKLRVAAAEESPLIETQNDPEKQLAQLQARYDALLQVKERASARYKQDFRKWRDFRDWLFKEEGEAKEKGLAGDEKKKKEYERVRKRKQKLLELEPDLGLNDIEDEIPAPVPNLPPSSPLSSVPDSDADKENLTPTQTPTKTPKAGGKKASTASPLPRLPALNLFPSPEKPISVATTATAVAKSDGGRGSSAESSSKATARAPSTSPMILEPVVPAAEPGLIASQTFIKKERESSPTIGDTTNLAKRPRSQLNSSDTEEDTQATNFFPSSPPMFKIPDLPSSVFKAKAKHALAANAPVSLSLAGTSAGSSTTTPMKSRLRHTLTPRPHPSLTPVPDSPKAGSSSRRLSDPSPTKDPDTHRPHKLRRMSDDMDLSSGFGGTPAYTPSESKPPRSSKSKGKDKVVDMKLEEKPSNWTPQIKQPKTQKRPGDYSAYKGRGRYAKEAESGPKTLNAMYEIDPQRNKGVNHQFEEVVRGRDERKQMQAGDCEDCREYYEAVGPMPTRLRTPAWGSSPPPTPVKPCSRHPLRGTDSDAGAGPSSSSSSRQKEIAKHKQSVSRHRHHWERTKTPPGYWNIGFPDTQEAQKINEEAMEMHKQKMQRVEEGVKRGDGKYRRRA
ncbi:hypothetical protein BDN72DRAFT_843358 [Pluteus cervinus]|uniref:Uncharacterized protein n=1 Tax=Pluteus cervinus TaxID=181527 RepID=A0ACD3ANB1_9AGAR|nr:hypothetical protein BDN72DRAFT_843358 [Pluteus cervinus]